MILRRDKLSVLEEKKKRHLNLSQYQHAQQPYRTELLELQVMPPGLVISNFKHMQVLCSGNQEPIHATESAHCQYISCSEVAFSQ